MKLKFKKQEFQNDAVMSVVDLFKGATCAFAGIRLRNSRLMRDSIYFMFICLSVLGGKIIKK